MKRQLLVYASRDIPDCYVITPAHLAHQAHVEFYWSASRDRLSLVPRDRARILLSWAPDFKGEAGIVDFHGELVTAA